MQCAVENKRFIIIMIIWSVDRLTAKIRADQN